MAASLIRRIGYSLIAAIVFFALAFAPLHQAVAESLGVGTMTADGDGTTPIESTVVSSYKGVSLSKSALVQGKKWSSWTNDATIGDTNGKGLRAFKLKLEMPEGLTGSVKYQTYKRGSGWKDAVLDGASTGSIRNVEGVRIKLTGTVSQHYDVLYRAYVSGIGWRSWVKNNATAGLLGKSKRVLAVQVKLSSKTEEARGKKTSTVGVLYQARNYKTGWETWKRDGATAGKKSNRLRGITVKADTGSLGGGLTYRVNGKDTWGAWKKSGSYAGAKGKRLEAIEIKLTGGIEEARDVYYRAYVQGVGWLDWAKNGETAGSTGLNLRLEKIQVKLVKKGAAAPGKTQYTTANQMEAFQTMNGIDIASWQAGINLKKVKADFVIIKATGGTQYVNPYYKKWADAALACGKEIGFYHYAREKYSPGTAAKEAAHFVDAVGPYIGKAVLFLDFEGSALNMKKAVKWAKKWMDTVYKKTGVKPLIYMSQSATWQFNWSSTAKKYKLWLAQYLYRNEYSNGYLDNLSHWDIGYWSKETVYQYSSTAKISGYSGRLDVNKFYGSVYDWRKLAQKS